MSVWGVVSKRSFWHQAELCSSLARLCDDPVLIDRYEDLTLYFVQNAVREEDVNDTISGLFGVGAYGFEPEGGR
jgi:hypothetical protein